MPRMTAGLDMVGGEKSVLYGEMLEDPSCLVSVAIQDEIAEIGIVNYKPTLMMFKFDMRHGKSWTESIEDSLNLNQEIIPNAKIKQRSVHLEERMGPVFFPPEGFDLNIMWLYDNGFKQEFGSNVNSVISEIMSKTQLYFQDRSLGTRIYLKDAGRLHIDYPDFDGFDFL